jgi:hypothetical protein
MILPQYLSDVAREMRLKSAAIRRGFGSHRPSAGQNREDLVGEFLVQHLPRKFGVSTGIVISHEGEFSNQADLVVVDEQNNAPLYGGARNKLWPIEAVYALLEIKTALTPSELADAIGKGRRFKRLPRRFCETGEIQRIRIRYLLYGRSTLPPRRPPKPTLLPPLMMSPAVSNPI